MELLACVFILCAGRSARRALHFWCSSTMRERQPSPLPPPTQMRNAERSSPCYPPSDVLVTMPNAKVHRKTILRHQHTMAR